MTQVVTPVLGCRSGNERHGRTVGRECPERPPIGAGKVPRMNRTRASLASTLLLAALAASGLAVNPDPVKLGAVNGVGGLHPQKTPPEYDRIDGAVIYDHTAGTKVGDAVFGTVIADMERDAPGRCSHGGPVCLQYPNGDIVAFYANTSDHNEDGWSEYAFSRDGGRTWNKYNKFKYSHEAYQKDPKRPAWVEEALVTKNGTIVVFVTHFGDGGRTRSGIMRSRDNGKTWTDFEPIDGGFVGYPAAVAVAGGTSYVLFDSNGENKQPGPHVLYASTDNGRSWRKRSTLTLDNDKWYGALCVMGDGRLLAGAYETKDEDHFHYCISSDQGRTWGRQERAYVDKKVRDPELAYLAGKYYLHGRSGHSGPGKHRFVLYQSDDGIRWKEGVVVSSDPRSPDGYSHNCIIRKKGAPDELMVEYSIIYQGRDTNEYVFFIKPE